MLQLIQLFRNNVGFLCFRYTTVLWVALLVSPSEIALPQQWNEISTFAYTHGEAITQTHTPRKSSEERVSKSQTCIMRMAGIFCSVLSREKMLSLLLTTTTCDREGKRWTMWYCLALTGFNSWSCWGFKVKPFPAGFTECDPSFVWLSVCLSAFLSAPSQQAGSWRGTQSASWSFPLQSESCSGRLSPDGHPPNLSASYRKRCIVAVRTYFCTRKQNKQT